MINGFPRLSYADIFGPILKHGQNKLFFTLVSVEIPKFVQDFEVGKII